MKNKTVLMLSIVIVVVLSLLVYEKVKFPVKYVLCDSAYKDCFVEATFKDMSSCQGTKERDSWYCDSTDKKHITCEDKGSKITVAYCSE